MTQHIFNTFRKIALSIAVKALSLRAAHFEDPDPVQSSVDPESDLWLFGAEPTVASHIQDLSLQMQNLSGTLGRLHSLVSVISTEAPMPKPVQAVVHTNIVWSDAVLFDGEPAASVSYVMDTESADDFLFDFEDDAAPMLDIAIMADKNFRNRESVPAS